MDLGNFEALFGEPKVEPDSIHRPFLFQVDAPDPRQLRVVVTDFFSTTFQALRSIQQLDDMRDETGVGGSWSDFLEYFVTSLNSGDVKLVLEGQSKSTGPESARLVAQKSKGMPRISVSLLRLVGTAANEAMATLSLHMYKSYKSNQILLLQEQEGRNRLTKMLSAEQEKSGHLQKQLDGLLYSNRQKIHDKLTSDTGISGVLFSPNLNDKQPEQNPSPMKAPKRVVPAHRRSKVRGALLQDTEDD
ncbi:hypothetical protein SSX86_023192 [Deinandra increscens subsp. villosa]|uniref:Uncharacterized protein n=1 Tax=Deinandra increscens subsp. villosa TaxID=3103831 RepID=A0AAP0GR03_9ASTR